MKNFIRTLKTIQSTNGTILKSKILKEFLRDNAERNLFLKTLLMQSKYGGRTNLRLSEDTLKSINPPIFKGGDMSVEQFLKRLSEIGNFSGKGSIKMKKEALEELLTEISMDESDSDILKGIISGDLRLGLKERGILRSFASNLLEEITIINAYASQPAIERITSFLLKNPILSLNSLEKVLHLPWGFCRPSKKKTGWDVLATDSLQEEFLVEEKYDGIRAQIHLSKGKISLFTRNLRECSYLFPELINLFNGDEETILDGEIISGEGGTSDFLKVSSRLHSKDYRGEVKFRPFDILYSGKDLTQKPLWERKEILASFCSLKNLDPAGYSSLSSEAIRLKFDELPLGAEGLMLKRLDGKYLPEIVYSPSVHGKKSDTGPGWYKLKREVTFDLLVLGLLKGRGRLEDSESKVILGCLDGDSYREVCRAGSGFSDEDRVELFESSKPLFADEIPDQYILNKNTLKVQWVFPGIIVEIVAGNVNKGEGSISLRFPRFKRFRRDKDLTMVTTLEELKSS